MMKLQPDVKKEIRNITVYTLVGIVLEIIALAVLHYLVKLDTISFDYRTFLSAICGGAVAVLNFVLMGITVQKVAAEEDEDTARKILKGSYSKRMLMQVIWIVVSIAVPCFNMVAGIAPLLFPTLGIKATAAFRK